MSFLSCYWLHKFVAQKLHITRRWVGVTTQKFSDKISWAYLVYTFLQCVSVDNALPEEYDAYNKTIKNLFNIF